MNMNPTESSVRNAWFAVVAGVVAGGITAFLGPTEPSGGGAGVTQIGTNMHGEPMILAALLVGVVSVGRQVDTEAAAVWTTLGAAPAIWWFVVTENTAVVFGAETTLGLALWSLGLGVVLAASFGLTLLMALVGTTIGSWIRRRGDSLVGRVPVE